MEQVLESLIEEVASMTDEERFNRIEENGGFNFSERKDIITTKNKILDTLVDSLQ